MHVYAQEFEGGGILWESLFMFIIGSLYMAELIFVVFISIKVRDQRCIWIQILGEKGYPELSI